MQNKCLFQYKIGFTVPQDIPHFLLFLSEIHTMHREVVECNWSYSLCKTRTFQRTNSVDSRFTTIFKSGSAFLIQVATSNGYFTLDLTTLAWLAPLSWFPQTRFHLLTKPGFFKSRAWCISFALFLICTFCCKTCSWFPRQWRTWSTHFIGTIRFLHQNAILFQTVAFLLISTWFAYCWLLPSCFRPETAFLGTNPLISLCWAYRSGCRRLHGGLHWCNANCLQTPICGCITVLIDSLQPTLNSD